MASFWAATDLLSPLPFAVVLTCLLYIVRASALKSLEIQFKVKTIFFCTCDASDSVINDLLFVPYLASYYLAH